MAKKKNVKKRAASQPKQNSPPTNVNAVGLTNNGVHCYMNATVQTIARVPGLIDLLKTWCFSTLQLFEDKLLAIGTVNTSNALSIFTQLVNDLLISSSVSINPKRFRQHFFSNSYMESHRMQDASEFLACFIDIVEREEASRFRVESEASQQRGLQWASCNPMSATFQGHQLMMHRCEKCHTISAHVDRFYILSLALRSHQPHPISHTKRTALKPPTPKPVAAVSQSKPSPEDNVSPKMKEKSPVQQKSSRRDNQEASQEIPAAVSTPTPPRLSKKQAKKKEREANKMARKWKHAANKRQKNTSDSKENEDLADTLAAASLDGDETLEMKDGTEIASPDVASDGPVEVCAPQHEDVAVSPVDKGVSVHAESADEDCGPIEEARTAGECEDQMSLKATALPDNNEEFALSQTSAESGDHPVMQISPKSDNLETTNVSPESVATPAVVKEEENSCDWLDFYTQPEVATTPEGGDHGHVLLPSNGRKNNGEEKTVREYSHIREVEDEESALCSLFDEKCTIDGPSGQVAVATPSPSPPPSPPPLPADLGAVKTWHISDSRTPNLLDKDAFPYVFQLDASESVQEVLSADGEVNPHGVSASSSSFPLFKLQDLLLQSFLVEHIDGDVVCEQCHGEKTSRSYRHVLYAKPPTILILQLKRFLTNKTFTAYTKDSSPVQFEERIVVPVLAEDGSLFTSETYSLHGVICHQGSNMNSGHYVSFVKISSTSSSEASKCDKLSDEASSVWMEFNDEYCKRVTWTRVQQSCPYIFLFRHEKREETSALC